MYRTFYILFSLFMILNTFNDISTINLIDQEKMKRFQDKSNLPQGQIKIIKSENLIYQVNTYKQPKFIYLFSKIVPLKDLSQIEISQNQIVLIQYEAKTISSTYFTNQAKVQWTISVNSNPQDRIFFTMSMNSDWKQFSIPLLLKKNIEKSYFKLLMHYGFMQQQFQIKNIKFLLYPTGTILSDVPQTKITYQGMEPNAKWRSQALKRIQQIRKGELNVRFIKNGLPFANQQIKLQQKKTEFHFGAAIDPFEIIHNTQDYKNFLKGNFNLVALLNSLKIKQWNQSKKKRQMAIEALKILQNQGIQVIGKSLIWPGFDHLTSEFKLYKDNPGKVKQIIQNFLNDILTKTNGYIYEWAAVNQCYTNTDLQNITGSQDILYNAFNTLKNINSSISAFANDFGILNYGGIYQNKRKWEYDFVKRIIENTGDKIDAIGFQSHIKTDLTPPALVIDILDFFSTLNKKLLVTEFTMDIQDPDIRYKYTRDFIIAIFSHPSAYQITFWGCTMKDNDNIDIFDRQGNVGVMGRAYFDLMKLWKTQVQTKTDEYGEYKGSAYYGTYVYKTQNQEGQFKFFSGNNNVIQIHLN